MRCKFSFTSGQTQSCFGKNQLNGPFSFAAVNKIQIHSLEKNSQVMTYLDADDESESNTTSLLFHLLYAFL